MIDFLRAEGPQKVDHAIFYSHGHFLNTTEKLKKYQRPTFSMINKNKKLFESKNHFFMMKKTIQTTLNANLVQKTLLQVLSAHIAPE